MKKELIALNVFRLEYPQLGELVRQHISDLENPANTVTLEEGTPLNDFVANLKLKLEAFEVYLKNSQKSEYTEPLNNADLERENDLRALNRFMKLLQMSKNADEQEAFRLLDIRWQVHKNLVNETDANQTMGIDNLLLDFGAENLQPHVEVSGITRYLNRLRTSNNTYKSILQDRNAQMAERITKEGVALRTELLNSYRMYANMVLSMAQLYENAENWDKVLSLLNVSRKKFAALLAQSKK